MGIRNFLKTMGKVAFNYSRYELLGNVLPSLPTVLQFPVTNRCNSKCIMCNIWQDKSLNELNPEQFREILKDKLFRKIRSVGLNGGEPTLRSDLPQITQVLVETLPELKSVNIITNAVNPEKSFKQISLVNEILKSRNKSLDVSISIDGVDEIHDLNRGVRGNFLKAETLLDRLRMIGVNVWCGCTITPVNSYWVDDILDWFIEKDLNYTEFRLGVDIDRLSNQGFEKSNPFTREQKIHLAQFLKRLIHDPALFWVGDKQFLTSLYYQLTENRERQSGCAWRYNGVTLDASGNICYCSVKSPVLGSALKDKPYDIYKRNIHVRDKIIKEHCKNCKHDLTGVEPVKYTIQSLVDKVKNRRKIKRQQFDFDVIPASNADTFIPASDWKKVMIVGWWGTETAGDKAILGELLNFLNIQTKGQCQILISSMDDFVVRNTFIELDEPEPKLISIDRCYETDVIQSVDAVIIGGGPLEDIYQMRYIWAAFKEAMIQGKERVIFGCGIDPKLSPEYKKIVQGLCKMASRGFFRDFESFQRGKDFGIGDNVYFSCDPAIAYVKRWASNHNKNSQGNNSYIATLIRANTLEYYKDESSLEKINNEILLSICSVLEQETKNKELRLLPMHSLFVGDDDRIYNRKLYKLFRKKNNVYIERSYLNLKDLLEQIYNADAVLAMRYHGHLFAAALGIPFISIDYTGEGGKVYSFIKRINWMDLSISWENFKEEEFSEMLSTVVNSSPMLRDKLDEKISLIINEYEETLKRVFKV